MESTAYQEEHEHPEKKAKSGSRARAESGGSGAGALHSRPLETTRGAEPAQRHRAMLERVSGAPHAAEKAALLLQLQQSHGNRYVQRLLSDAPPDPGGDASDPAGGSGAGGRPLERPVRSDMEERFGTSFPAVRVHTDPGSGDTARALGARAFTTGQDIYFSRGAYRPETPEGKHLLAHELAHTLQQRGQSPGTQAAVEIVPPDDPLEREAERVADDVTRGVRPVPSSALAPRAAGRVVQRQPADTPATAPGEAAAGGPTAEGDFVIALGGLTVKKADVEKVLAKGRYEKDLSTYPLPGLRPKRLVVTLQKEPFRVKGGYVTADLAVPFVKTAGEGLKMAIDSEGKVAFEAKAKVDVPALNNPEIELTVDNGDLAAAVTLTAEKIKPRGIPKLKITEAAVTVGIAKGKVYGDGHAALEYQGLARGDFSVAFKDGEPAGKGKVELTPDYLRGVAAELEIDSKGNLAGALTLPAPKLAPPVPGLKITDGTITVGMKNGELSGKGENITFGYQSLGTGVLGFSITKDHLEGSGSLDVTIPGVAPVKGQLRYTAGRLSGKATITADKFPKALPIKGGSITVAVDDKAAVSGRGSLAVGLFGVGQGELKLGYEKGILDIAAEVELTKIPGLDQGRVLIGLKDGQLEGEGEIAVAPKQIPGISGALLVVYKDERFSGRARLRYAKDKFSGEVELFVAQDDKGKLAMSGSGEVTARLTDWLTGMVHVDVLPDATMNIAGELKADDVELFPAKKGDRELFSISQNIPLWAILVAVIRLRGGVRAGVGPGRLRGITARGTFSTGEGEEPSFSITGELYIPAYAEAYVAIGAGLGLDIVIGSLTGGIEAVGTAGIYGAVSVIPEIAYEHGDFTITGVATLAAGAKLKLALQAWAEVEAFWITVWEDEWKLAEWVWDVGPELALQASMKYVFGHPEPPTFDFKTSDIDAHQLIQDAMPKEGPKGSGAREALKNTAEWKGALKAAAKDTSKIPPELADKHGKAPETKAPPPKPPKSAPPADLKAKDPDKTKEMLAKDLETKVAPDQAAPLDKEHQEGFDKGMAALEQLHDRAESDPEDPEEIEKHLADIKSKYGFATLTHRLEGEEWVIEAGMSLTKSKKVKAGKGWIPTKTPEYGAPGRRGGTWMAIHPLSRDHGEGTDAEAEWDLWSNVNQRRNDERLYVRGHLLSNKMGGPGDVVKNLTPITFSANKRHYSRAEEKVLELVDTKKKMVHYEVEPDYPGSRSRLPRYTGNRGHEEEALLARKLTVRWWELKMKGANDVERAGPTVEVPIDNVPEPDGYPNEDAP